MNAARTIYNGFQNGKRWIKGDYWSGDSMCLVGALAEFLYHGDTAADTVNRDATAKAMAAIITEQYPDRISSVDVAYGAGNKIIDFNDHPDTTWMDVDRVLEKLAVKLEEMP